MHGDIAFFAGNAHPGLASAVAAHLGIPVGNAIIGSFDDGECRIEVKDDVRGKDVFLFQPTGQPDRNFIELCLLVRALKSPSRRITAVIPYFGYARQDRRDKPRVPISVTFFAKTLVSTGVDRVVLFELHSPQTVSTLEACNENLGVDNMFARPVILDYLDGRDLSNAIITPVDSGVGKVVSAYGGRLHDMGQPIAIGSAYKDGTSSAKIEGVAMHGDFNGRHAYIFDDMIATCRSMREAIDCVRGLGASAISVIAVHPVFARGAAQILCDSDIVEVITTDSLPISGQTHEILGDKLKVVSIARLMALVIDHIHRNLSVSALFELAGYRTG